jgi:hypothetical protein
MDADAVPSHLAGRSPRREHARIAGRIALGALLALAGGCCAPPAMTAANALVTPASFLGPADFQGGFLPRSGDASDGLQSTYSGFLTVAMLDRAIVEAVLPAGVALAPNVTGSTQHPVVHLIGDQLEPSTLIGGVASQVPGGGYGKEWRELKATSSPPRTTNQVTDVLGRTYFLSDVQLDGPWAPVATAQAASVPRWSDLRTIFEMPVLGFNAPSFICSYWEWDFAGSEIAPASSSFQFFRSFVPGMQGWVNLGTLANAKDGAVALSRVRWRLAAPVGCQP